MNKLWFDTETGGLNSETHSLLTAYFAVVDNKHQIIDELYLQMKPENESDLFVEAKAMEINKIDLTQHLKDPETLTYSQAQKKLIEFFERNKLKGKRKSLQPCGHNIQFDKDFVWAQLIPKDEWDKYVHYRTLDTSSITAFLKDIGFLPSDLGNLSSLVEYYDIPMKEAHHAKDDVLMNIQVYKAMTQSLNTLKGSHLEKTDVDLLKVIEV